MWSQLTTGVALLYGGDKGGRLHTWTYPNALIWIGDGETSSMNAVWKKHATRLNALELAHKLAVYAGR